MKTYDLREKINYDPIKTSYDVMVKIGNILYPVRDVYLDTISHEQMKQVVVIDTGILDYSK